MGTHSFYSTGEFKAAILLVWMVLTLVGTAVIITPFVLNESAIARLTPVCESKRLYGRECVLCGTTTGFIAIAHGELGAAARSNGLAIPLFAAFSLNTAAAVAYFLMKGLRRNNQVH
jgi:hypothetical protein